MENLGVINGLNESISENPDILAVYTTLANLGKHTVIAEVGGVDWLEAMNVIYKAEAEPNTVYAIVSSISGVITCAHRDPTMLTPLIGDTLYRSTQNDAWDVSPGWSISGDIFIYGEP